MTALALSLAVALLAAPGCGEPSDGDGDDPETETQGEALDVDNGLKKVINGLRVNNGLASTGNGLSVGSGLATSSGLASNSGLMTSAQGRMTASYLVRCALPPTRSIRKADQYGNVYTFKGGVGLAPAWENGSCNLDCQLWVSACMLSMVNTTGKSYPLWMVAETGAVGWGLDGQFPYQEAAFFGNIFSSPSYAYYCEGRDFGKKPVPGRLGDQDGSQPYTNRFGNGGRCSRYCSAPDAPHQLDGYRHCGLWSRIVTIWHQ
jgi:hypothetical protein